MSRAVFIVGSRYDMDYENMFLYKGWDIADRLHECDLVQFTGGEDVSPSLYGEGAHPTTQFSPVRDRREKAIFESALKLQIPMAGICRGGQFLNVMCGGKMWQNVDGHTCGSHEVKDVRTGEVFMATSTHHQMMRAGPEGTIILVAAPRRTTLRERMNQNGKAFISVKGLNHEDDLEAVHYPAEEVFCFQPHPEFQWVGGLRDRYFGYLGDFLGFF